MPDETLLQQIADKKAELDRLRPQVPHAFDNLNHAQDIELTYSSNAIEGNTLTAAETMLVVEQGITIGGKPLKDHLEAIDHYEAIAYVRRLARQSAPFTEWTCATCIILSCNAPTPRLPDSTPTSRA
jgi:Fic family protein